MILPNYLYYYILELIINYKYNRINNTQINNNFNSKDYHHGINSEVLNYSIVNKKFFEIISKLLYKYYSVKKNNNLFYYFAIQNNNKNQSNNQFKLFKYNPFNSYNSLEHFKINTPQNEKLNFIKIDYDDIEEIKDVMNNEYKNCEFDIGFSIDEYKNDLIYFIKDFKNDRNNIINLNLNGTECEDENSGSGGNELLKKIMKLNPVSIKYEPNDDYCQEIYQHMNYTPFFENNSSLNHLEISSTDHVDPFSISKLNNKITNLKSLSLSMLFHDIIKGLNNQKGIPQNQIFKNYKKLENECDSDYGGLIIENSISQDWHNMIQKLKSNSTIKELSLNNFCYKRKCIEHLDISKLTTGLKQILTSPISKIKTLELLTIDFLDSELLNGLEKNKTIKDLILMNTNESLIFKNVLSKDNKTIRNIYLNSIQSMDDFLNLLRESTNMNLYSITIKLKQFNYDLDISNFKTQYSSISISNRIIIKELNFYSCNNRRFKTIIY